MSAGNSTRPPEVTGRCRMNHRLFWDSAFPRCFVIQFLYCYEVAVTEAQADGHEEL